MKYGTKGVQSVTCRACSTKYEMWSGELKVSSVDCGVRSGKCKVQSVKCEV